MRIWHEQLITKLCRQHLLAQWREGLGCFNAILFNKKGYSKHPQVIMYKDDIWALFRILIRTKYEMLHRGYKPKEILKNIETQEAFFKLRLKQGEGARIKEWQSLEEQVSILKKKGCKCDI